MYLIQTASGSILCSDGEWRQPLFVGPGAYAAKLWKTEAGARRAISALGRPATVSRAA